MRRFEREVVDYKLIEAMLQEMNIINVGMNDEDGFPYVVPMSFGFEMTDTHLNVYTHFMKVGKKVELLKKDPRVCIEFSIFNDFPDKKYKGPPKNATFPLIGLPQASPLIVWLTTAWKIEAAISSVFAPSFIKGWTSVLAKTPHLEAIG